MIRRQDDAEDASATDLAFDRNGAPRGGDDAMADGETEAGSAAAGLGGEEGIEDARQEALRNARTGITDLDHRASRCIGPRDDSDLVGCDPTFRDRMRGVHDQVDEYLAELGFAPPHER